MAIPAGQYAEPDDEAGLTQRLREGQQAAFVELMRRYNRRLYRTTRSILRDDQEAEDALQDAWLSAFRNFASFRGEASMATWLTRIAVNAALARRRQQQRGASIISLNSHLDEDDMEPEQDLSQQDPEPLSSPELEAARGEMRAILERSIDQLPDPFRTVFVLRALEEMPSEEVAAVLGIPEATARTRYFRARAMLRDSLARQIDLAEGQAFGFEGGRCDRMVAVVLATLQADAPS
jgi:RNA polymerase sigma-70 factor, ECF subfamily